MLPAPVNYCANMLIIFITLRLAKTETGAFHAPEIFRSPLKTLKKCFSIPC
jgi:hypothetical protein